VTDYSNKPGGALFAKDPSRKTNPNQPDYDGYIVLDPAMMQTLMAQWKNGEPMRIQIAGWKKQGRSGPFVSLNGGQLPRQQQAQQRPAAPRGQDNFVDDDDIPF
jgi:hypothetical protein